MMELPLTTTLLLERLCARGESGAWEEIDARYRPVLRGFARGLGLSEADAEDAAQCTLAEASRLLRGGEYRREKGRLRSWIIGIARHRVLTLRRAAARRAPAELAGAPDADDAELETAWDRAMERAIFERAWEDVRASSRLAESTLRAFELVVLRGTPAEAAAAACGLSVDSVYASKSRILKSLRERVEQLTRCYEDDA